MTTYTSQPDETTGIDAFIANSGNANANFGGALTIATGAVAGNVYRGLIKFDLSSIPVNAIVSSAILSLTVASVSGNSWATLGVHRLKRAWAELQATWVIWATGNNWVDQGGFNIADCESTMTGSVAVAPDPTIGGTINITLNAAAIQAMINGSFINNGFMLKTGEASDQVSYNSCATGTAALRPKLVIEYTVPPPAVGGSQAIWWN